MNPSDYLHYLEQWLLYSGQCSSLPFAASGCRTFWVVAIFSSLFCGALVSTYVMYQGWRRMRAWESYQRWLADYEEMDPDTANQQWKDDKTTDEDAQGDFAQQVRRELFAEAYYFKPRAHERMIT